jgi:hypothetical protein
MGNNNVPRSQSFRIASPALNKKLRRRRPVRIALIIFAVLAPIIFFAVMVQLNSVSPRLTAKQSLTSLNARMQDAVTTAKGDWTYEDESKPWQPGKAPDYAPPPCNQSGHGPQHYKYSLLGPGVADPLRAAEVMTKHWESLGYEVRIWYQKTPAEGSDTILFVDLSHGSYLEYSVNNVASAIGGASECLPEAKFPKLKWTW